MSDLSPALLEELAKGFNPDAWDESKALPADVRAKLQYWAREAVSDLAPILSRALAEAAEQMRELVYMDVRALPGYVDHTKGTSGFEIGDNSRVDVLRTIRATTNPYLTEKEQSQ